METIKILEIITGICLGLSYFFCFVYLFDLTKAIKKNNAYIANLYDCFEAQVKLNNEVEEEMQRIGNKLPQITIKQIEIMNLSEDETLLITVPNDTTLSEQGQMSTELDLLFPDNQIVITMEKIKYSTIKTILLQ